MVAEGAPAWWICESVAGCSWHLAWPVRKHIGGLARGGGYRICFQTLCHSSRIPSSWLESPGRGIKQSLSGFRAGKVEGMDGHASLLC